MILKASLNVIKFESIMVDHVLAIRVDSSLSTSKQIESILASVNRNRWGRTAYPRTL